MHQRFRDESTTERQLQPRLFAHLVWSNLFAQIAEQIGLAASPLIAVLAMGAGVRETGFLQTIQTLPFLLWSLPAGVLADRAPRRLMMTSAELIRTGSLVVAVLLLWNGHLTLAVLAVLGFIGASGTVAFTVAAPAIIPSIIPAEERGRANGRLELARSAAFTTGPALAGTLVASLGGVAAFLAAAACSLTAAMSLWRMGEPPRAPAAKRRHVFADAAEGAVFALRHPHLRPLLITAILFNTSWFIVLAAFVPYAVATLGASASQVGFTWSVYGIGMICGALVTNRFLRKLRAGTVMALGPLCGLAGAATLATTIWSHSLLGAAFAFFLFGSGPMIWSISTMTLRQAATPDGLLGRVNSVILFATFGARPLGAAIGALIGARFGTAACLLAALLGFLAQAIVFVVARPARLRTMQDARLTHV